MSLANSAMTPLYVRRVETIVVYYEISFTGLLGVATVYHDGQASLKFHQLKLRA